MSLFGKKEKQELERLKSQLPPEQLELAELKLELEKKRAEYDSICSDIANKTAELTSLNEEIIETDERVLYQSFGIYTPHYYYTVSDDYKKAIKEIREEQKALIKEGDAVTGNFQWTVNGSSTQGKKMVKDMQKLLLRAFNAECDDAIEHVKFNNIDNCEKKISTSSDAISKLGKIMDVAITAEYYNLKLAELRLVHEYQIKKEEEKEAMRELKEKQREEAKAAKEMEEAKKKLEKEQTHFENALEKLNAKIANTKDDDRNELLQKKEELEAQLSDIAKQIEDVDYRAANQKAGYVYIISNIGAFGENVYKIGMTRRLDPQERIDELGSASVPFKFDVHAMIFTEDAPALEGALHKAFEDKKLNYVNLRKEFFNVTLDEIKQVVKENFDKTVEFIDYAPAEQYRTSLKIKEIQQMNK